MEIYFYLAMQLGPNSTQMQAGLPVILVCCGAHLGWSCCCSAPPVLQRCFSTCSGDPHPPCRVFSPADLTGENRAARARCKNRHLDALAGSHFALRMRVVTTCPHLPLGEWALAGGFRIWGFCLCLP